MKTIISLLILCCLGCKKSNPYKEITGQHTKVSINLSRWVDYDKSIIPIAVNYAEFIGGGKIFLIDDSTAIINDSIKIIRIKK